MVVVGGGCGSTCVREAPPPIPVSRAHQFDITNVKQTGTILSSFNAFGFTNIYMSIEKLM